MEKPSFSIGKLAFLVYGLKNLLSQFEILSFSIEIRVPHQKTRFFYGNSRFFKNMSQMASMHMLIRNFIRYQALKLIQKQMFEVSFKESQSQVQNILM